jgi:hypothetical protein
METAPSSQSDMVREATIGRAPPGGESPSAVVLVM